MTAEEIGKAIKAQRVKKGQSQLLLAGLLGKSRTAIIRAETRTEEVSLKNLIRVLDYLELEFSINPKKQKL